MTGGILQALLIDGGNHEPMVSKLAAPHAYSLALTTANAAAVTLAIACLAQGRSPVGRSRLRLPFIPARVDRTATGFTHQED